MGCEPLFINIVALLYEEFRNINPIIFVDKILAVLLQMFFSVYKGLLKGDNLTSRVKGFNKKPTVKKDFYK